MNWKDFGIRESKIFRKKRLYLTFTENQFLGLLDALSGKEKLRAEYYEKIGNLYFITTGKKKGVN